MGGEMDGMDDLDAPAPPMGDGMDDPIAGGPDDMDNDPGMNDPMGGNPDNMGGEDPMAGGPDDMGNESEMGDSAEDDELMNIINNLSIEDKAAVTKYAKSMTDDGGENPQGDGMMPESRKSMRDIIDETISSLLDKDANNCIERPGKKINSKLRGDKTNPFVSPF